MSVLYFEEFTEYIEDHIVEYLPMLENPQIKIHKVTKNNGMVLTSLEILDEGEHVTPSIYLERFYDMYRVEKNIEDIMKEIADFFVQHRADVQIDFEALRNFEMTKEHIVFRLVNKEWNEALLENCPYIMWNDLAISFRWLVCQDEKGIASAIISNNELESWGIDLEELYLLAMKNTARCFPITLMNMEDIVMQENYTSKESKDEFNREFAQLKESKSYIAMYVLTNEQRVNGATTVLYEGALKAIAEQLQSDFYILPSSIHEVILVEDSCGVSKKMLRDMVLEANYTVVETQERLSDNVYHYSMKDDCTTVVAFE